MSDLPSIMKISANHKSKNLFDEKWLLIVGTWNAASSPTAGTRSGYEWLWGKEHVDVLLNVQHSSSTTGMDLFQCNLTLTRLV